MPRSLRHLLLLAALAAWAVSASLIVPGRAAAAAGSVSLDQPAYVAHESQGALTITIVRTGNLGQAEHVGYGVRRQDAQPGIDFHPVANHYITMAPGQASYSFSVPIIDRGMNAPPVHALAYLYGSWPDRLGAYRNSPVTILHDDPLGLRDPVDPLGVAQSDPSDPLAGAQLYVDPDSAAALAARTYRRADPGWSSLLGEIAAQPSAHRFYMWSMGPGVAGRVAHYLERAALRQPGTTALLSTYSLVHGPCGYTATPAMAARYHRFISQVAAGIGNYRVVVFLEVDSLITSPCLDRRRLAIREAELRDAVSVLEADPHALVYLDGGAADAIPAARQASLLRGAGVAGAQGFFLNSTHFDWTTTEIRYGQEISRRLGGAHFIVNTGENGRGPLVPVSRVRYGNEVLCNPPGRGLGPLSLTGAVAQPTGYAALDGLLWLGQPGGSGGACVPGAPPTGAYWPAYAVMLARNGVDHVTGPRVRLVRQ